MANTGGVLIAGRNGQVALELARAFAARSQPFLALGRTELDLADSATVEETVVALRPAIVVNAAAYTAVDKAEEEPELATAINAIGAGRLARSAHCVGAPIIHISTDYVYDGLKPAPYVEKDATSPLGIYGASKLEGEHLVADANSRHVILRTAWVFSPHGHNFVKTMLRLGSEREEIGVVADQKGAPTSAADLADAIVALTDRILSAPDRSDQYGVFHAVNSGATTWHGFASAIMSGARRRGLKTAHVNAIATADFPTRARRPANSILDASKLLSVHGIVLRAWEEALEHCLDDLIIHTN